MSNEVTDNNSEDSTVRALWLRLQGALRNLENREAVANARLSERQDDAKQALERLDKQLKRITERFDSEANRINRATDLAKGDLATAHRAAADHCSEVGVQYLPGRTMQEDVLRVPLMTEDCASKILELPFGLGITDGLVNKLKLILAVVCWFASSLSLGLSFRLLNPKNLLENPTNLFVAGAIGALVALGMFVMLTTCWKKIGAKIACSRPRSEVVAAVRPIAVLTLLAIFGLAFLDAKAIVLLNSARAEINPALGIPMIMALVIGMLIGSLYVTGLAATAFAEGYSTQARAAVRDHIRTREVIDREELKKAVPVRAALEALSAVEISNTRLERLEAEALDAKQKFDKDVGAINDLMPEIPTHCSSDENVELVTARERCRVAEINYHAYRAFRCPKIILEENYDETN